MDSETNSSDLEQRLARFASLVEQTNRFLTRIPEMKSLVNKRNRAQVRFGKEQFRSRTISVDRIRTERIEAFYTDFRVYCERARESLDELRDILPNHEVDKLLKGIHPTAVTSTCQESVKRRNG